ncbi:hypothetical protein [Janthinobacterium fluminis]|uniref:DUF306 domain-containing protein n=1 Tax=Janthinobacterium fluminis TaxID=2987524 RepID=A0ABT5K264_9BURK|nr:hypothetical protein [Janthinobacterium fluminis]MDC8758488.1 hypothetical protein [Janthinobacterium fluminis]
MEKIEKRAATTLLGKALRPACAALAAFAFFCAGTALASDGGGASAGGEVNADICGRWKIAKVLDFADITAISEREAKKLIGKTLLVAKDKLVFDGETCEAPSYERTVEDTARTMREKGRVSSANMGLSEQVTVIDAGCTDLFLKGRDRIVLHWRGFYFDVVKQKR